MVICLAPAIHVRLVEIYGLVVHVLQYHVGSLAGTRIPQRQPCSEIK